ILNLPAAWMLSASKSSDPPGVTPFVYGSKETISTTWLSISSTFAGMSPLVESYFSMRIKTSRTSHQSWDRM
ncbi:hypothetical protein FRB91_007272, partial [Serendipita sp. 411]